MAEAYFHVDWLNDSSVGLDGGHNFVPCVSIIDTAGDDPYEPVIAFAPMGSVHPMAERFPGLVVLNYGDCRLLNEKTYIITIEYGPATNRTINLWRRSTRFASETRPFKWSLPEESSNTPARRVGSNIYVPHDSGDFVAKKIKVVESTTPGVPPTLVDQRLKRTEKVADDANLSVNDGITAIMYDAFTYQLTTKRVREISSVKWSTNKFKWLGYPTWTLLFSNWACDDDVMAVPVLGGRPTAQWFSNVTVEVLYRPITPEHPYGWRSVAHTEAYHSESGGSAPVLTIGDEEPVTTTHIRYPEVDFYTLFPLFGPGNPGN